jgi:hypothetical protein
MLKRFLDLSYGSDCSSILLVTVSCCEMSKSDGVPMATLGGLGGTATGLAFGDARGEIDGGVPGAAIEGVKGALDGALNANQFAESHAQSPGQAVALGILEGSFAGRPDPYPNDRLELLELDIKMMEGLP